MNGSVLCLVGLLQLFTVHPVLALQAHPAHAPHWHHPSRHSGRRIQCGGRGSMSKNRQHVCSFSSTILSNDVGNNSCSILANLTGTSQLQNVATFF